MPASSTRSLGPLFAASMILGAACSGDDELSDDVSPAVASVVSCPVVVRESDCDKSLRPIVFIHGTFGAGDNGEHVAMLFGSNGYCQERFVAVDYNSLGQDPYEQLDALITKVLAGTGQTKVDLMGHSQGGGHGYTYLSDPARAARVANYIHLAGGNEAAPPSAVRTMSMTSKSDAVGLSYITGAEKQVTFETQDHMGVAMSVEAFVEMYRFLLNKEPLYTEVQCGEEEVTLAGKAETFGDNTPLAGGTVEFYELGTDPRKRGKPVVAAQVAADGSIGPIKLRRGVIYEGRALGADGKVLGHSYNTPWKRSDYLLRALVPSSSGLTSNITNMIPKDDKFSVVIARYNRSAIRADLGHTLTIDGANVLVPEYANASTTTVAYFLWDNNANGVSDNTGPALFNVLPFIRANDVYIQAETPKLIDISFNGVSLKIPNWPSASEGPTVVMFQ